MYDNTSVGSCADGAENFKGREYHGGARKSCNGEGFDRET